MKIDQFSISVDGLPLWGVLREPTASHVSLLVVLLVCHHTAQGKPSLVRVERVGCRTIAARLNGLRRVGHTPAAKARQCDTAAASEGAFTAAVRRRHKDSPGSIARGLHLAQGHAARRPRASSCPCRSSCR